MFSVVIPLYNKEISIKSTIESVLNQTFDNFELIVVDDGSTDASPYIVSEIKDDRIKLIRQKNQGVSVARNRGVKEAKYKWIAFLDGDDLWKENHLVEILKMMDKYPDRNVYVTSFEYSDGRYMYKLPRNVEIFKIDNYFKESLKEYLICTDVIVINKESFNIVGGFNENLNRGEDLDLWARLAREYEVIKSSKVTAIYRIEAENRSVKSLSLIKSRVYNYNFSLSHSEEETLYYKIQIIKTLRSLLKNRDLKNFRMLQKKHSKDISLLDIIKYKI